ncbi:hypothetical protein [Paenibacillus graminis]|uniref:hypothetical protein n=1 Tax=Paenibacillus graminis TaxID=189425 RepID=UPI002DBC973A|nr:hypothetical protein [Paenibacillus graminis]MEC0169874.1 hypothetical protein [Paenibacillus graminis]
MSKVQQLDLFALIDPKPTPPATATPILNGMYYERATGLFVTYIQGRRHYEVSWGQCLGDKAWKDKTKRERAI